MSVAACNNHVNPPSSTPTPTTTQPTLLSQTTPPHRKPIMCSVQVQKDVEQSVQTDTIPAHILPSIIGLISETLFQCVKIPQNSEMIKFIAECAQRHLGTDIIKPAELVNLLKHRQPSVKNGSFSIFTCLYCSISFYNDSQSITSGHPVYIFAWARI